MKEFKNSKLYKHGGITKLKISNFRSVSTNEYSQTVNLAPLTIICGENSSGKSTLLNSILFLKQTFENNNESAKGSTVVDLNGPLVQLGEYSILKNLNTNDEDIQIEMEIVGLSNDDNKKLYRVSLEMEPITDLSDEVIEMPTGYYVPRENQKKILNTKKLTLRSFENTSHKSWLALLKELERQSNPEYDNPENETEFKISFDTEIYSFVNTSTTKVNNPFKLENGPLDLKYFELENEETTRGRILNGDTSNWNCGYELKSFLQEGTVNALKSKYEYALPRSYHTDFENTQKLNVSDISVEKWSKSETTGNYQDILFQGGIPNKVNHRIPYFEHISNSFVKIFSEITNKDTLSELYSELALELYGDEIVLEDELLPNIDELPEADNAGYVEASFDQTGDETAPNLEDSEVKELILEKFSSLFELQEYDKKYIWEFFNKWETVLDLPYISDFDLELTLSPMLHAENEYKKALQEVIEEDSGLIDASFNKKTEGKLSIKKDTEQKSKDEYELSLLDLFADLNILINSSSVLKESFYVTKLRTERGDVDNLILSELSSIINDNEISKDQFVQAIDGMLLAELSADIQSVLYNSMQAVNEQITTYTDNFKSEISSKSDTAPIIGTLTWITDQKYSNSNLPEPSIVDLKLLQLRNSTLNSVKYIGPLRDLKNYEKKNVNFDKATPIGLNAGRFFNYFHEFKNKQSLFTLPNNIEEFISLSEAFNIWLKFFEIAESFDTYYEVKDNNLYGMIKPMMLEEEIRMDSLGVGFSQLAPIILLCLNATEGDTILLEQPELHLHPSVQQKFGDFLLSMSKSLQIIVETHSDHMINRIRRRVSESEANLEEEVAIYFAERIKGNTTFRLAELDKQGSYKLTDFPKGFFDQGAEDAFALLKNSMLNNLQEDV
jgi:predicted ATPase